MSNFSGFICELFISYQGEGPWIGKRQVFIRLAGCSRHCAYCDTRFSWKANPEKCRFILDSKHVRTLTNPLSVSDIVRLIREIRQKQGVFDSIVLTGGEPLYQIKFLHVLVQNLKKHFKETKILLETNGLEDISDKKLIRAIDFFSLDFKIQSSSHIIPNIIQATANLKNLKKKNGCVKVIVNKKTRVNEMMAITRLIHRLQPKWELIVQPQSGKYSEMLILFEKCDKIIKSLLLIHEQIRFLPQMHRYFKIK